MEAELRVACTSHGPSSPNGQPPLAPQLDHTASRSFSEFIINVVPLVMNMHLWAPIFLIKSEDRLLMHETCCLAYGSVLGLKGPHPFRIQCLRPTQRSLVEEHRLRVSVCAWKEAQMVPSTYGFQDKASSLRPTPLAFKGFPDVVSKELDPFLPTLFPHD